MEPQSTMEVQQAWKLVFAPYAAQASGALAAVSIHARPAAGSASLTTPAPSQILALPVVASVVDAENRLHTRATAVLVSAEANSSTDHGLSFTLEPLPADTPCAAIRSIIPLKGRFPA